MPIRRFLFWVGKIFGGKKKFRLAIYGLPNAGKTSLANRISMQWTGRRIGRVSQIPHETRSLNQVKEVTIRVEGKEFTIDLIDVPGISHKNDLFDRHYKMFLSKMSKKKAKQRVSEAILGVKKAVVLLDYIDTALLVMDSSEDPYDPTNFLILGALKAKKVPVIIVANKIDLPMANPASIRETYDDYPVVELSAKKDKSIDTLYKAIAAHHK
ncbi:MAG: Era-like GTP-binding protein [Methanobacteriota archaeon]